MPRYPWFRFYSEVLNDRKIKRICRTCQVPKALVIGVWATLLALANDSPERGKLMISASMPLDAEEIREETGLDATPFDALRRAFETAGMLSFDDDGGFVIDHWQDRNPRSDHDGAERVKRYRQRKRESESNVTVTLADGTSNALEEEGEEELDQEEEKEVVSPSPPTPPKAKKSTTKRKKPAKPVPEAVKTYRSATNRYPPKSWYEQIDTIVGTDPPKLKLWYRVCHGYVGKGWNPGNAQAMLDYFQRGEIPGDKDNGNRQGRTTQVEEMDAPTGWLNEQDDGQPTVPV